MVVTVQRRLVARSMVFRCAVKPYEARTSILLSTIFAGEPIWVSVIFRAQQFSNISIIRPDSTRESISDRFLISQRRAALIALWRVSPVRLLELLSTEDDGDPLYQVPDTDRYIVFDTRFMMRADRIIVPTPSFRGRCALLVSPHCMG